MSERFEVVLREKRIRNSISVDRFWVVRDWNHRGTAAMTINVSYPAAQVTAMQWAKTMNELCPESGNHEQRNG